VKFPKPRRKWHKWAISLGFLVVVVPFCAAFVLVSTPWGQERMRDAAVEAIHDELGLTATLETVDVQVLPYPRVVARGIVLDDPVYGTFAEADGLIIRPSVWALLRGTVDLHSVEIEGPVGAVDPDSGLIDIALAAGTISVTTDQGTRLDDDRDDIDRFTLADIVPGDFLEIEAYLAGDRLVATVIDREETDDEVVQAPVESFNAGSDITLLGVTFSVSDGETEYENLQDQDIPATAFFAQLQPGDLVKLKDDELADGVADEIEFEDKGRLDGEREFGCGFDDDGASCNDDDLIGDDTISDDDGIDTTEDEDDLSDDDGIDTPDDEDDLTDDDGIDTPDDEDS